VRTVHKDDLDFVGSPLEILYVLLSTAELWDRNPHDGNVGQMIESIQLHGFRDPPEYDSSLLGFPSGNHRTIALRAMQKNGYEAPKYIGVLKTTGEWCIPVVFGADAGSKLAAEAYGIDANNMVMGGDFEPAEIARLWKPGHYESMLVELAENQNGVASVDGDHLDALLRLRAYRLKADSNKLGPQDTTVKQVKLTKVEDPEVLQRQYGVICGQVWQVGKKQFLITDDDLELYLHIHETQSENVIIFTSPEVAAKQMPFWEQNTGNKVSLLETYIDGTQNES